LARPTTPKTPPPPLTRSGIKQLIVANAEHGDALPEATASAAAVIMSLPPNTPVDATVAEAVETLWTDPTIRSVFAQRSKFQLPESVDYFFGRVREVAAPGYVPSVDDVLNLRVRTSGIHCEEFIIDGVPFDVYDVGGQKSERRKWIHAFDDVTAVIFVAAISEFDQVMFEDESQNRLVDSLALFEEVVNSRHFAKASTILFLNKYDLFLKKLADGAKLQQPNAQPFAAEKNPVLNADYTGGQDPDAAVRFLVSKYLSRCNDARRDVFWRVTCATDTGSVGTVLHAAKETILRQNLLDSGLVG
jgi:guanine nucleotide-binding protein G(i) subunit alpha